MLTSNTTSGSNMPAAVMELREVSQWVRLGVIALAYFVAAKASLIFAIPPGYATAIWPPSGIALAALLICGLRTWPGVWLGAAITNYTVDLSVPAAASIATGNTLEGVAAAWLVLRLLERNGEFGRPESVFLFAGIAALASALAATIGVTSLWLVGAVGGEQYLANWYTWWQGDATGILLVTPCILAWARDTRERGTRVDTLEIAAFSALLLAALLAVFAQAAEAYDVPPLAFLCLPFFVWAACRFSERAVTLIVLVANGWAIWCTVNGLGPFGLMPVNEALLSLQAFTSTGALIALVLWALLRRRAEELREVEASRDVIGQSMFSRTRELREQVDELREKESMARMGSWRWDAASSRVVWSDEMCRICGVAPGKLEGSFEAYFARLHADDREHAQDRVKTAYARYESWDGIERIVRPDGGVRVVRSIGRVMPAPRGGAARMYGVCIDITGLDGRLGAKPEAAAEIPGHLPLPEALRAAGAQFELRTGVAVEVVSGAPSAPVEANAALALFRVAQEALDNVSTHAHAHRVMLELECEPGLATLTVRDDGSGFSADWQTKGGVGIKRMRERVAAVGGRMWIESSPGSGSTLRVTARG